ncbi:hypothetical protein ACLOJK_012472 [Asimina triloba]
MDGKGKTFIANLASIYQYYEIPKEVELLAADIEDTSQSSKPGCISINESIFKARVELPFEFDVSEALNAFRSIINWKLRFFFTKLVEPHGGRRDWDIPITWQMDLKKPRAATLTLKGQETTFKLARPLTSKLVSKGPMKVVPLEDDVALERFALTMKEVAELEVSKRGQKRVLKRPLAHIKEEVMP